MRPLAALALALAPAGAAGACASATQSAAPFDLVGVGLAGRLDGEGARAGLTLAYWTAGYRGWGSFAKMRLDAVTGLDLLMDDVDEDDEVVHDDGDDDLLDDHVGAFVFDGGVVYRFADNFAAYGGAGIGNKYAYDSFEDAGGDPDSSLHSLEWGPNFTAGLLWMWGPSGGGLDVGYDTFDRSFRIAFVVNYAGTGGNWLR
jgi:hypothetical protein